MEWPLSTPAPRGPRYLPAFSVTGRHGAEVRGLSCWTSRLPMSCPGERSHPCGRAPVRRTRRGRRPVAGVRSSWTKLDDRLALASLGWVEGGNGLVEGCDVA